MEQIELVESTIYAPVPDTYDRADIAERKWPLKWTFLFVVTTSITLWAGAIFAVWHLI